MKCPFNSDAPSTPVQYFTVPTVGYYYLSVGQLAKLMPGMVLQEIGAFNLLKEASRKMYELA